MILGDPSRPPLMHGDGFRGARRRQGGQMNSRRPITSYSPSLNKELPPSLLCVCLEAVVSRSMR